MNQPALQTTKTNTLPPPNRWGSSAKLCACQASEKWSMALSTSPRCKATWIVVRLVAVVFGIKRRKAQGHEHVSHDLTHNFANEKNTTRHQHLVYNTPRIYTSGICMCLDFVLIFKFETSSCQHVKKHRKYQKDVFKGHSLFPPANEQGTN